MSLLYFSVKACILGKKRAGFTGSLEAPCRPPESRPGIYDRIFERNR